MKRTAFPQICRAEADESPYAGESLSERLEQFIKDGGGDPPTDPPPVDPPKPKEVVVNPDPPVDPPADGGDGADDDDFEELPAFGSKQKVEDAPDLDFDAQTDAIVAAITAKGHPGDEYKRLRAELKALKTAKPIADIDSIPEVQTLKQKAAEAEQLRLEAEALRQRNKELLQVNNEVEVKESDEFISKVTKPIENIEAMVKQIAAVSEIDASTLFSIIAEPDIIKQDKLLEQLHQKVGSRTAGRIERFCDDYKAAEAKGAELLASSGKNAEKARLARETAAREEASRKVELFKASVESSFTKYAKAVPGFTDSSGNLTDVAQAAMASASVVDLNSLGPDDIGYLAFTANALPEVRRALAAAKKELAILKGTKKPTAPIAGNTAPPPPKEDDFMGLSERMKGMEFTFTPPA